MDDVTAGDGDGKYWLHYISLRPSTVGEIWHCNWAIFAQDVRLTPVRPRIILRGDRFVRNTDYR